MSPATRHVILISPLGDLEHDLVNRVGMEVARVFGYPTEIMPLLADIESVLDANRQQYHSTPLLEALARSAPPPALKVLGIVTVDLFIPILTHVYGEAQLGGRACVVSTHRLEEGLLPSRGTAEFQTRLAKESIHEMGHTFGLRHCKDPACLMHYCRSIRDVDKKASDLCRYCRIMLDDELKRISLG